ncbi:YcfL family protein [Desulfovibrio sp. OttesenSCG-928-C06]|nr:YcfL family protein [Desulfovibrio sp. OttesenSCG-928-C06]
MLHTNPLNSGPARSFSRRLAMLLALMASLVMLAGLTGCGGRATHEYADNEDVEVESIQGRMEGDLMLVYAVLRNSSSDDVNDSVYRVEWYDADGFLLEQTSWRPVKVKGGAAMHVRERSTIPGAKEYTLVISNDSRKP